MGHFFIFFVQLELLKKLIDFAKIGQSEYSLSFSLNCFGIL